MRPTIRWNSLRTKIIAWSFVPTTIILVAVALVTFYAYQRTTEDLVVSRNREVARLSASQLRSDLSTYTDLLATLARTADVKRTDPAARQAALDRAGPRLAVFDGGVVQLDSRGVVVASEPIRPEIAGQDWSDRSYSSLMFRSVGPVFSNVVADGPSGEPVIVAAVPITGDQGEILGVLAGLFRLGSPTGSSFYGSIVKLRVSDTAATVVVDGEGRVVYHTDQRQIGESRADDPFVRDVLAGRVDARRASDRNGRDIVASFAPIPDTKWGLITEESWNTVTQASQGYTRFLLVLLGLGIVVPTVVVFFGVRRITQPIAELISAAREVSSGSFGRIVKATSNDELAELAEQFNRMSAELKESYSQLEQRVEARTRQLETLNAVTTVVSDSLDLEEVFNDALDQTLDAINLSMGTAYIVEQSTRQLRLMAHRGLSDEFVQNASDVRLEEALAASEGGARLAPVVRTIDNYPEGPVRRNLERAHIRLIIAVPLLSKGVMVGSLVLFGQGMRFMSPEETSLLAAIGRQVGVAVENAMLYEHAEEAAAAAERNRLARDLHDAVTQTLFSASLIAEVLPRLFERDPAEGARRLEELRQLTRGALAEMRTLLLELRPAALTEAPLANLLKHLAEATTGRSRIPVTLRLDCECQLSADVKIGFYRIAQEALNNVAKHSGATQAEVSLRHTTGQVTLTILDDGRGFDREAVGSDHLGLGIMCERAQAIGATLEIESGPDEGTELSVTWRSPDPDFACRSAAATLPV